ncbi:molybdopterin-binding aldehyde dehydrogenase-like protein [Paraburkholderia sp. BL10I2N1]|nr:molybdopterin-binding aldehyde dehydrogenase-like protein [Paraburkholderia sp. BL10I2N1]
MPLPTFDVSRPERADTISGSRRRFLKGGLALAGSSVLPLAISEVAHAVESAGSYYEINDWVRIDPDGRTIIGLSQAEVGQGVYTGLPQVLADEMDADWRQVMVEFVTGRDAYRIDAANEPPQQFVGASMSVTMFYTRLRLAGAQAREAFITVAARRLKVRGTQCVTSNGRVTHTPTGRSLSYGESRLSHALYRPRNDPPAGSRCEARRYADRQQTGVTRYRRPPERLAACACFTGLPASGKAICASSPPPSRGRNCNVPP